MVDSYTILLLAKLQQYIICISVCVCVEVAERDLSDKAVSLLMESLKSLTDDQLKEKAIEITKTLSK